MAGVRGASFLTLVLIATAFWITVGAQEPDCVCFEHIPGIENLRSPTKFAAPNDGSGKKYVAEQLGIVWILDEDNTRLETPFMDIQDSVFAQGEEGFLSMVFHPDYANNGQLFIYYSTDIDGIHYTRLSSIYVNSTDPDLVDYSTERAILDIEQRFDTHNGGDLMFGTDGYLYLSTGDGGTFSRNVGDPFNNAQNLTTFLGTVIRIDVGPDGSYTVPPDNPFVGDSEALPEIYAYGFRNPWRMSMDTGDRQTGENLGRVWIADVGKDSYEEVNILAAGLNYGWAAYEADSCFKPELCPIPYTSPVISYNHSVGQSVTGGHVYRGCRNPNFNGWYIFGDYMAHKLFRGVEASPDVFEYEELFGCSTACTDLGLLNDFGRYIQSFGQAEDGEIYMLTAETYTTNLPNGNGYRIVDPSNMQPPCA